MFYLVPVPKQFVDFSGVPYSCGSVTVYIHGTTDKAQIYSEAGSSVLLPNPCQLDSNGAWKCFVPADTTLDYIVQDRDGNVVVSYMNIVLPGLSIEGDVTKEYVDAQNQLRDRNFARDYNPAQAYPVVGTYVMHGGGLHKSIIVIDEPEEWNAEHWAECNVTDELNDKIAAESQSRTDADAEIITSLKDEMTARRVNDELLQQQIENVAAQTDWDQDDIMALDYLKNKPTTITDAEIDALFI